MTLFSHIEIGRSALRSQQKGMEVSGQNVANANTEGYTRQRADMSSRMPGVAPNVDFAPGQGVEVSEVKRVRSEFYHEQMMKTGSQRSYWETRQEAFSGAEAIFKEPDDMGLGEYMGEFFDLWNELSSNPESEEIRASLRETTKTFTSAVQDSYSRLEDLKVDLQEEADIKMEQFNSTLDDLAQINEELQLIDNLGDRSNELLDKRDQTLEELSEMMDISVHEREGGVVDVFASGEMAVQGDHAFHFDVNEPLVDEEGELKFYNYRGEEVTPRQGTLRGLQEATNEILPNLQDEINDIAYTLSEEINKLHKDGYGLNGEAGNPFFAEMDPEDDIALAHQFEINPDIAEDTDLIAASTTEGDPGNGDNALNIQRVRDEDIMNGQATVEDHFRGVISSLGVEAQESQRMKDSLEDTENELQRQHDSIADVDIDEEMTKMIEFQHAWSAASRFLSYIDGMMETLFVELGR